MKLKAKIFYFFKNIKAEELNKNEVDVTKTFIQQRSPVYPGVEERIILLNLDKAPEGSPGSAGAFKISLLTLISLVLIQMFK